MTPCACFEQIVEYSLKQRRRWRSRSRGDQAFQSLFSSREHTKHSMDVKKTFSKTFTVFFKRKIVSVNPLMQTGRGSEQDWWFGVGLCFENWMVDRTWKLGWVRVCIASVEVGQKAWTGPELLEAGNLSSWTTSPPSGPSEHLSKDVRISQQRTTSLISKQSTNWLTYWL